MPRLPARPELDWKDDGTPIDRRFDDVYYSVEDGLSEARTVFLQGCGLPDAWKPGNHYTVAELGFGTGLNFLATWQAWRQHRKGDGWLHFVSFEGFLLDQSDARKALSVWPELASLAAQLCDKWPTRAKGTQQILWPEEKLSLTLHIGLIEETLPQSRFLADAWFLDGFSPAKNDQMWSELVYSAVAERCAAQARLATFTVAGRVRRGLQAVGFAVEKCAGHGRKRERLEARFTGPRPDRSVAKHRKIAIFGAGIAGACLAYHLRVCGAQVTVFEHAEGPGRQASGNPLALVMPRLDAGDTVQARLLLDAYIAAQAFYAGQPGVQICETVQRPRDAQEAARFDKVLADPPLDLGQMEALPNSGLLHKQALAVRPDILLPALLEDVDVRYGTHPDPSISVAAAAFDAVIYANGCGLATIAPELGISERLGQVDWIANQIPAPASAIAAGPYAVAADDIRLWGATFEDVGPKGVTVQETATAENRMALAQLDPYWRNAAARDPVQSRASVRATTVDRLPLIGPLPDRDALVAQRAELERRQWRSDASDPAIDHVYIAGGYGSRGFTWGPWAAHLLSADILGMPTPTAAANLIAVLPSRQIIRDLKRRRL